MHQRVLRRQMREVGKDIVDEVGHSGGGGKCRHGNARYDVGSMVVCGGTGSILPEGAGGGMLGIANEQGLCTEEEADRGLRAQCLERGAVCLHKHAEVVGRGVKAEHSQQRLDEGGLHGAHLGGLRPPERPGVQASGADVAKAHGSDGWEVGCSGWMNQSSNEVGVSADALSPRSVCAIVVGGGG